MHAKPVASFRAIGTISLNLRCGLPRLSTCWSSHLAACSALLVDEKQCKLMLMKQGETRSAGSAVSCRGLSYCKTTHALTHKACFQGQTHNDKSSQPLPILCTHCQRTLATQPLIWFALCMHQPVLSGTAETGTWANAGLYDTVCLQP